MAPQQNSTLIHEDCPSLWNIPDEINHCSPILPPKNKENLDTNNNCHKNTYHPHENVNFVCKWELTEKEKCNYYRNKHRIGSHRSGHSHRSRSISLYGANSAVEQGHTEITVWLDDEPRYISGVTNKTTCNDIIKALIDDEISNGNYEYYQRPKDGTASRDYSDYVITECWRGIERSYDGNMAILPVWKAWSRVNNEIRLNLKHHKNVQDPLKALKTNTTLTSIRDYICKLLSFGKGKKRNSQPRKSNKTIKWKENEHKKQPTLNEVMLRFNPDIKLSHKMLMETKNAENEIIPQAKYIEIQAKPKINKEKLYKLSETRSSVRKRRSASRRKTKKFSHDVRRNSGNKGEEKNFIRKRNESGIRSSVRNKLAQINIEMNELYEREYALTRDLTNKCKVYKLHNELYTACDKNLEMSVGQIQRSIEACAKEIIQTEHELLEVKNEIKHDISFINNLKRLTINTDPNECDVPIDIEKAVKPQPVTKEDPSATIERTTKCEQMLFVDNIYEFCDNNASMLV